MPVALSTVLQREGELAETHTVAEYKKGDRAAKTRPPIISGACSLLNFMCVATYYPLLLGEERVLPTCQVVGATGSYGLHPAQLAHLRRRVDA